MVMNIADALSAYKQGGGSGATGKSASATSELGAAIAFRIL